MPFFLFAQVDCLIAYDFLISRIQRRQQKSLPLREPMHLRMNLVSQESAMALRNIMILRLILSLQRS